MQLKKKYYYIFQVSFFAVTTFLLHFLLFEFWSFNTADYFWHWLPVLIFDLVTGIFIGSIISICSVLLAKDIGGLRASIVVTDVTWLIFCFSWYTNNKGGINVEAVGHIISPVIAGFLGMLLAGINLFFFLFWQNEKVD